MYMLNTAAFFLTDVSLTGTQTSNTKKKRIYNIDEIGLSTNCYHKQLSKKLHQA